MRALIKAKAMTANYGATTLLSVICGAYILIEMLRSGVAV